MLREILLQASHKLAYAALDIAVHGSNDRRDVFSVHGFRMQGRKYLVCCHRAPAKKNRAVKNKSTTTTRKMDITTARVVDRPTCSAPPPVVRPSRHPTAVMVMPNITLLISPEKISRRNSDSMDSRMYRCKVKSVFFLTIRAPPRMPIVFAQMVRQGNITIMARNFGE